MDELRETVESLKKEMAGHFSIKHAQDLLDSIDQQNDPALIKLLVPLLDDKFEYDEFMYSIIHCIERFEIGIYVGELLACIPEFIYKSPRWASIVHMCIINSKKAQISYIKEIKQNGTVPQKAAIKDLLDAIDKASPEFLSKTIALMVAL